MDFKNLTRVFGAVALLAAACGDDEASGPGGANCQGAKCDNAADDDNDGPARTCGELIKDRSGNGLKVDDIKGLDDPIAKAILSSDAERCPMSVADIVEVLKDAGCSGHGSALVSERSQLLQTFTDYRSVTQMECGGQSVFLHYPITLPEVGEVLTDDEGQLILDDNGKPQLTGEIDANRLAEKLDHTFPAIMAEDVNGVFNYYQSKNQVNRVCTPRGGFNEDLDISIADAASCDNTLDCDFQAGETCVQRPDDLGVVADFRYFGDSMDFVALPDRDKMIEEMAEVLKGPVTTEADVEHSLDVERNCAVCHPNGGLTMRELKSPWVHWDFGSAHFTSPKASELISSASDVMGSRNSGLSFEGTVDNGNRNFVKARVEQSLKMIAEESEGSRTLGTGELLRPLFCTDEFNILTSGSSPGRDLTSANFRRAVLDERITPSGASISTSHEAYLAHIEERDWQLWGFNIGPFAGKLPAIPRETLGTLTFIHAPEIQMDYADALESAGIIDDELITDAMLVDFTRAVFSEERCDLVEVVDRIDPSVYIDGDQPRENAPKLLRDAIIDELASESGQPAADFLALLQDENTQSRAKSDFTEPFIAACKARGDAILGDYLDYVAQVRKRAAHQETGMSHSNPAFMMFRFPFANGFMMPDAMSQPFEHGTRFDPETCELITNYPGEAPVVDEPEDPPAPQPDPDGDPGDLSCDVRGCTFDQGASCQCDAQCKEFDDCCDFGLEARHDGPSQACE